MLRIFPNLNSNTLNSLVTLLYGLVRYELAEEPNGMVVHLHMLRSSMKHKIFY